MSIANLIGKIFSKGSDSDGEAESPLVFEVGHIQLLINLLSSHSLFNDKGVFWSNLSTEQIQLERTNASLRITELVSKIGEHKFPTDLLKGLLGREAAENGDGVYRCKVQDWAAHRHPDIFQPAQNRPWSAEVVNPRYVRRNDGLEVELLNETKLRYKSATHQLTILFKKADSGKNNVSLASLNLPENDRIEVQNDLTWAGLVLDISFEF